MARYCDVVYRVAQKSKPLPTYAVPTYEKFIVSLPMTLNFFVKLKYQSSTIILSVGNKYSVRDLLCDIINNA